MNYIKEMNAFYDQVIFNPLSGSAVALWHTLMHFSNKSGWRETFSVPATLIETKSGVKGSSFKRARTELQDKGYINVIPGNGNQSATYRMISQVRLEMYGGEGLPVAQQVVNEEVDQLEQGVAAAFDMESGLEQPVLSSGNRLVGDLEKESAVVVPALNQKADQDMADSLVHSSVHSTDYNMDHNPDHSTAPLFKQYINQTETKQKPIVTTTSDAIRFYQENFGAISSYLADDIINWIADMGDPLVLHAMKRALEQNKANFGYVKGILKAWVKKGIRTVEQAEADEMAFRKQRAYRGDSAGGEVIPDWFREREEKKPRVEKAADAVLDHAKQEEFERLLAEFGG
ncbi:DnaD domain-containing protein [Virgibacillus ihumii]|uniref:DnaD domain-containing protein n=1 Tax=Virgibacillus ihumii TaxID=2686091 RepID=UPI00157CAA19|nr:DnaD domain protein [Virgibacillus ihumii]